MSSSMDDDDNHDDDDHHRNGAEMSPLPSSSSYPACQIISYARVVSFGSIRYFSVHRSRPPTPLVHLLHFPTNLEKCAVMSCCFWIFPN